MLRDVFLASIFVAYVEPKHFFTFARENSPVQPLTSSLACGNAKTKSIAFESSLYIWESSNINLTVTMFTTGEYVSQ